MAMRVMMSVVMMLMVVMVMVAVIVVMFMFVLMLVVVLFVHQRLRRPESVTYNALSVYGNGRQDGLHRRAYDVDGNARVEQGAQ